MSDGDRLAQRRAAGVISADTEQRETLRRLEAKLDQLILALRAGAIGDWRPQ